MSASGLDYLLIARCLLLSLMMLPGVGAPSTAEWLVHHLSHLGALFLLAALIVMCLFRARGALQPDDLEAAAMPPPP